MASCIKIARLWWEMTIVRRGASGTMWVEEQLARECGRHDNALFFLQASQTNRKLMGETDLDDAKEQFTPR